VNCTLYTFIHKVSPEAGGVLGKIASFLCPLIMLAMMLMMFKGSKKGSCCDHAKANAENDKSFELNKFAE